MKEQIFPQVHRLFSRGQTKQLQGLAIIKLLQRDLKITSSETPSSLQINSYFQGSNVSLNPKPPPKFRGYFPVGASFQRLSEW